ncbi:hypothetical protein V2G26_014301 [Clonostachys chloroleuca]
MMLQIYTEVRERLENKYQSKLALWATVLGRIGFLAEARETMKCEGPMMILQECTEALEIMTEVPAGPGMVDISPLVSDRYPILVSEAQEVMNFPLSPSVFTLAISFRSIH